MNKTVEIQVHIYTDNEISWELYLKRRFSVYTNHRNKRKPEDDTI